MYLLIIFRVNFVWDILFCFSYRVIKDESTFALIFIFVTTLKGPVQCSNPGYNEQVFCASYNE